MNARSSLVVLLCLHVSTAWAATIYVGSDYITIQAAIDAAQDGDRVVVPPGIYDECIDFAGKAVTVAGSDPQDWNVVCNTVIRGAPVTTRARGMLSVGADGKSCVAFVNGETSDSILEGLTLTEGRGTFVSHPAENPLNEMCGGGVLCIDSSPTIRYCNIVGNLYVTCGAGIALIGECSAAIDHCVIASNEAQQQGGGILIVTDTPETAVSRITNCTITDNEGGWTMDGGYEVDCGTARPVIANTIIYGNEARSLRIADVATVSYCCLRSVYAPGSDEEADDTPLAFVGIAGNIDRGPWFTETMQDDINPAAYHLGANSPCIDAGDPDLVDGEPTDIDGQARVMGGRIDIGADETIAHLAVHRPTSGDTLAAGSTQEIVWSRYAVAVDVRFSQDGGATWLTVVATVTDATSTLWQVPETLDSDTCIVSVVPSVPDPTVQLSDSGPFTIHPDATGSEVTSEWPSLGGDTTRNGQSTTEGLADGRTPWEQNTGAVLSSVTIGFDGRIHAASEDGRLYTFAADGNALWTLDVNAPLISAPSIGPDGSLFVGGRDGKLRAIAPDGTLRWTFSTDDAVYSSPAVDADGNVYFGSTDGMVYALAADGSERWQFATKGTGRVATGAVLAAPAIGTDGTIYIGGLYDPNLYALNPADGRVEWACRFEAPSDSASPGWPFAAPVIGRDGTIYQTLLYDSHLYAIDPSDGTILWATDLLDMPQIDPTAEDFDADADGWSEPALAPDGTIYVSLDDPYLRALNPDGTIKWVTKLGDLGAFTLTVDARGWVYAACDDGYVYLVDPDGLQIGRWATSGWPVYPVLAADGTVLIGDSKDYSMLITEARNVIQALTAETLQAPAP